LAPSQHGLQDQRHGVQVDAGLQNRGDREAQRDDEVRAFAEALVHELGHRTHAGAVVERHHENAEEHHAGHCADQIVMNGRHANLRAVRGHAQNLSGTKIGRAERQTGDPSGHRTSGEQEVLTGFLLPVDRVSNPDDHSEINSENQPVDPA
jgi:hypothetical protein